MKHIHHDIIVNYVDDKIVSTFVCVIIPNVTRSMRPTALIENVVTREDYRGKDYATECLNYAKKIAEKENCYKIMLLTGSKEDTTLNFYRKAGYNRLYYTNYVLYFSWNQ